MVRAGVLSWIRRVWLGPTARGCKHHSLSVPEEPLHKRNTVASPAGHVFPEFKESDAMFAAERVSSAGGEGAGAAGQTLLSCPLPTKPSVLAFLHFMQIKDLAGSMLLPAATWAVLGWCTAT